MGRQVFLSMCSHILAMLTPVTRPGVCSQPTLDSAYKIYFNVDMMWKGDEEWLMWEELCVENGELSIIKYIVYTWNSQLQEFRLLFCSTILWYFVLFPLFSENSVSIDLPSSSILDWYQFSKGTGRHFFHLQVLLYISFCLCAFLHYPSLLVCH